MDPILRLAHQRIVKLSADIEVQLADAKGGAVAIEILRRLRDRAAESLAALAVCNFDNPAHVRTLRNEVMRYDEWLSWLREIVNEGIAYDKEMTADERQELLDLLTQTPAGQQEARDLGLIDDIPRDA